MKDNIFDVENQQVPEAWRDDVKTEGPNIPDIADRINGIVSNAHRDMNRSEENMDRYRNRVIEMIENTAKAYHQSQLQALKEKVEEKVKSLENNPVITDTNQMLSAYKDVLNLITDSQDK